MKKLLISTLLCLAAMSTLCTAAFAQELLVGGQVVGIKMKTAGLLVAGLTVVQTDSGECSPAESAGIKKGDMIVSIDSKTVEDASDFIDAVNASKGESVNLGIVRGGKELTVNVTPVRSAEEQWMLGMLLRDKLSGIGTLTFCDPATGTFGALGHSVNDTESGTLLPLGKGSICDAEIIGISPGAQGAPGALNGCTDDAEVLGSIEKNTDCGIFGKSYTVTGTKLIETGDIAAGPATILSTINGSEVKEYSIRVDRVSNPGTDCRVLITVTDPELCSATGGIVQGMSGSPIIQNNKLVGAVTHVFINDPKRGYGIGIDNMLSAAA